MKTTTLKIIQWNGDTYDLASMTADQLEQLFSDIYDVAVDCNDPHQTEFRTECTHAWQAVSNELSDRRACVVVLAPAADNVFYTEGYDGSLVEFSKMGHETLLEMAGAYRGLLGCNDGDGKEAA